MTRVENRPPRLFINANCSISYRQEKRGSWTSEGRNAYGILFLFSGRLRYETDAIKGELQPGTFLLINPTSNYEFASHDASLFDLGIKPSLIIDCSLRMGLGGASNSIVLRSGESLNDSLLARLARELLREMTEVERGHEAAIAAVVEQLLIHLLRNYSTFRSADTLELSRAGLVDRRIRRAVELMLAQLDQELSLKDLAAASFLSPFHFARLFKKLTGTTPHAYLAALRTATAQRLLAETDLSIREISARVGYSSPSHFSKGFRQTTGLTPRAFRSSLISRS